MTLQTTGLAFLLTGLLLLWLAGRRIVSRRFLSGGFAGLGATVVLALGALLVGLSMSFHVLDRLSHEEHLGTIELRALGAREFEASLRLSGFTGRQEYRLAGDQWQLHVRFLKWQNPATLLGMDSLYQLDRLNGRYEEPDRWRDIELTSYSLVDTPGRLLWRLAQRTPRWLPWIDAVYGNSVFLPMADGARYEIAVTASGLIARPQNPAAVRAIEAW